jgi:ribose/xylose/arabinose/galactoside ABC-type transport system permease subunit
VQQIIWRVTAFIATLALVVMASGVAEPGSRGRQTQSGGGQPGSNPTATKNQPNPKMTINVSPEYTRTQVKTGSSPK